MCIFAYESDRKVSTQTPERCSGRCHSKMLALPSSSFLGFLVLNVINQPARIVGHGGMGRAAGGHGHVRVGAEGPGAAEKCRGNRQCLCLTLMV